MLHIPVKKRSAKEKKAKDYLRDGYVPGIVYGPKMNPTPVYTRYKKFFDVYKKAGETTLIELDFASEEKEETKKDKKEKDASARSARENVVLIRDVQKHPVSGEFQHVDFYQLPMDQPIEITVPIESLNEAPAVKEQGGVLVNNLYEVDIKALPKDLIHEITIDISGLENIGDALHVNDLSVPDGVEILAEEDEVVFAIEEPLEEEEEEEEELEETEEDAIEGIKTEGEEKREEREAEAAEEEAIEGAEGKKPAGGGEEKKEE